MRSRWTFRRPAVYSRGPRRPPIAAVQPGVRIVIETIGPGRDYATPADWEVATDNNLVAANEIRVGEIYDNGSTYAAVDIDGATTDKSRYRILRAAAGEEYDPITDTGVKIEAASGTSAVRLGEDYSQLHGIKATLLGSASNSAAVLVAGDTNLVMDCVGEVPDNNLTDQGACFGAIVSANAVFINCIAIGTGGASTGPYRGFFFTANLVVNYTGCGAYAIDKSGSTSHGFGTTPGSNEANTIVRNCWAFDSGNEDFHDSVNYLTFQTSASSDTTGSAAGLRSLTATNELVNPLDDNFRAQEGSALEDAATDLTGEPVNFLRDFTGATRVQPTEIGPYDGVWVVRSVAAIDSGASGIEAPARVDQTVSVAAIDSGAEILAPDRVDQTVDVATIDSGAEILAPDQINQTVSVAAIDSGAEILAPNVVFSQDVAVAAIDSGAEILAPDRVDQTTPVAAIDSGAEILAPDRIDQTVSIAAIDSGAEVLAPDRVDRDIDVAAIDSGAEILAPDRVDQTTPVAAIDSGAEVLAPDRVDQTVDVGAVDSGAEGVIAPGIVQGQLVNVAAIDSGAEVLAPDRIDQTVSIAAIDSGAEVLAPDRIDQTASVDVVDSGTEVLAPGIVQGQLVSVAAIDSGAEVLAPDRVDQTASVAAIDSGAEVLAPDQVDQTASVDVVDSGAEVLAPDRVDQTADVAAIDSGAEVLAPDRVDQTVSVAAIDSGAEILAPTIPADQTVNVNVIDSGAEIVAPTVLGDGIVCPVALTGNFDKIRSLSGNFDEVRELTGNFDLVIELSASECPGVADRNQTFTMFEGDDVRLEFTVTDEDGSTAKDLTGLTTRWSYTFGTADAFDPTPVVTITATDVDLLNGRVDVTLAPADTDGQAAATYYWQLEAFDATPSKKVLADGTMTLVGEIKDT